MGVYVLLPPAGTLTNITTEVILDADLDPTTTSTLNAENRTSAEARVRSPLEDLEVLRAPNIGGHRNWFCRKALLPFGSHSSPPVKRIVPFRIFLVRTGPRGPTAYHSH